VTIINCNIRLKNIIVLWRMSHLRKKSSWHCITKIMRRRLLLILLKKNKWEEMLQLLWLGNKLSKRIKILIHNTLFLMLITLIIIMILDISTVILMVQKLKLSRKRFVIAISINISIYLMNNNLNSYKLQILWI